MFIILAAASLRYISYVLLPAIKPIYFHPFSHIPGPKWWIAFPLLQHFQPSAGDSTWTSAAGMRNAATCQGPAGTGVYHMYIDKLIERLKGFEELAMAADMGKWYNLTTFDLTGDFAFFEQLGTVGVGLLGVSSLGGDDVWACEDDSLPARAASVSGGVKGDSFHPGSFMEERSKRVEHA
ncbi:hypothetical protein CNMCM5623_008706 [Aspergillus felis]|uniref:Uncharacterized protein n=1 Tax=Aspergillus felis TaxID=1287682 RepID=A0A8H6QVE9_9EURO|nr:hypothetical protein CNMCM5623_008706 [Aspergillus felis]KAF7180009.1 hypothetical protein CNMCM7691_009062 [Aspergillus felis]